MLQLHQTRDSAVLRSRRGIGGPGEAEMAGPKTTYGLEEVRRVATGTQAPGSGHHQGRTGYDRDTGSKRIIS